MSSSITVWTSASTRPAESLTALTVRESGIPGARYDSVSLTGCDPAEARTRLNDAFNHLVSLTSSDTALHILAVVPLFEEDAIRQIDTLSDACAAVEHKITLHVLGLADGIRHVLSADSETDKSVAEQAADYLRKRSVALEFAFSFTIVDDYAANGAPVGFTLKSLTRYISCIQMALMQDYYAILTPALLAAHPGCNLSLGVASLSFDRRAMCAQLLGLGFLASLDAVGINDRGVDAQKAAHEAESVLAGIADRYPALYERAIRPLYRDQEIEEGRVVADAAGILDEDIERLKSDILALLTSDRLSLPEKEAVLALVLGRDNENITGMQYEHDGSLLDDACTAPIKLYVDAFNRHCRGSGALPVRDDFRALRKYVWNEDTKQMDPSPENEDALNPLPDIKRLKQEILNTTSYIREKSDELDRLQESSRRRSDADEIRHRWHRPSGGMQDVEYKEQPLDDKYTPPPGLGTKDTVDLRTFFGPVRDQSSLGACTSFAVVSMYEAMMSRAGVPPVELSPAYLYYYSNVMNGRPGGGSNFAEQFGVMGRQGICSEALFFYDADNPAVKPSQQADDEARLHRVLRTKQLPLTNTPDKPESLRRNHALLTAALTEGYPVGISLKIYENFGADGPFILHPDDSTGAREDGWHALVLVGYSEADGFYIARNSWGENFGEGGYCYIPMAYVDDPDYMDFACIITEITDAADTPAAEVPSVLANFAATETDIRMAAIRNAIAKMRIELRNYQSLYTEYYKYYQRQMMQLTMPKVQNRIREAAEAAQRRACIDAEAQKKQLENTFVHKLKDYKNQLTRAILIPIIFALIFAIWWFCWPNYTAGVFCLVFIGLSVLAVMGYKWWMRIRRRQLQEEVDRAATDARNQAAILTEMQIRFHVAGMWLCRFHKLSLDLGGVYDRLISYNNVLRAWHKSYSGQVGSYKPSEGQMFRTLGDLSGFRDFFHRNEQSIVSRIDLIRLFESYQVEPEKIEQYRRLMCDTITDAIDSLLGDFSIVDFLLGAPCDFLAPVSLQDEIGILLSVGQPTCRNRAMNATTPVRILTAYVRPEQQVQWAAALGRYFPLRPSQVPATDMDTLLLLTIHPITDTMSQRPLTTSVGKGVRIMADLKNKNAGNY